MWSSIGDEQISSKTVRRVSSSSSTTTSSSAQSPSPFSSSSACQNPRTKTMEEVWKEINLSSPRDDRSSSGFRGMMMFQDFLARPLDKDPHQNNVPTNSFGVEGLTPQRISPISSVAPSAPPSSHNHQLPATMLTLNSGPEFSLFGPLSPCPSSRQSPVYQPRNNISHACALNMQFDGIGGCFGGINAVNVKHNKRSAAGDESNNNAGDRRHKRMIKNRESAARSRARKQAYTTELELEVDLLTKENARLKEQQRQLSLAASANQPVRRTHTLHRTSTAPF